MTTLLRRGMMQQASGGSILKETVSFTVVDDSFAQKVPINADHSKILFIHFYDNDELGATPTASTTYEGWRGGNALIKNQGLHDDNSWNFWRTNAAGTTTGWNTYGYYHPFRDAGYVWICSNPKLRIGHEIIVEVYYEA